MWNWTVTKEVYLTFQTINCFSVKVTQGECWTESLLSKIDKIQRCEMQSKMSECEKKVRAIFLLPVQKAHPPSSLLAAKSANLLKRNLKTTSVGPNSVVALSKGRERDLNFFTRTGFRCKRACQAASHNGVSKVKSKRKLNTFPADRFF